MGMPPYPDDDDRTVRIPAPTVEGAPADSATRRHPGKRGRPFSPLIGIMLIAVVAGSLVAAGAFFLLRGQQPPAVPSQPAREAIAPPATPPAGLPAPPPAPSVPERPFSPRQMLNEIFEGRNRGHSVTASVDKGTVRISSSKPGYLYVLAAGSDVAVLFVAVLFPNAAETANHIRPGQMLRLPDSKWPTNAQFLAIVSDQPRDFGAVGPMAGKVNCASATPCSESYGAVIFSGSVVSAEPAPRDTAGSPAAPKAPAARPTNAASRRCSDILERASLGEVLTAEEYTFLRRDCR